MAIVGRPLVCGATVAVAATIAVVLLALIFPGGSAVHVGEYCSRSLNTRTPSSSFDRFRVDKSDAGSWDCLHNPDPNPDRHARRSDPPPGIWDAAVDGLKSGVHDGAMPGATALVASARDGLLLRVAVGNFTYGEAAPHSPASDPNPAVSIDETLFDMASMTKVLASTTAAAQFYERGELGLDTPVCDPSLLGPSYAANGKGAIAVHNLLEHNAGFPPDPVPEFWSHEFDCPDTREFFPAETYTCRSRIYDAVLNLSLINPVGKVYIYSDLSFITLMFVVGRLARTLEYISPADLSPKCAAAVEHRSHHIRAQSDSRSAADTYGDPIDQCYYYAYLRKYVFSRLFLQQSDFLIPESKWGMTAPTWNDTVYRHQVMQGTVSDGNAYALGGIAGHAGLFSTGLEALLLASVWSLPATSDDSFTLLLNETTIRLWTRMQNSSVSSRALGWDTLHREANHNRTDVPDTFCGTLMSLDSIGHTGYTGTQACIDPTRGLITVLLTNRVYPDVSNVKIYGVRNNWNDAVVTIFDKHFR